MNVNKTTKSALASWFFAGEDQKGRARESECCEKTNEAASGWRSRDWSVRRPARKPVGLSAGRRACLFASFLCTRVSRVSHKGVRRRRFHATWFSPPPAILCSGPPWREQHQVILMFLYRYQKYLFIYLFIPFSCWFCAFWSGLFSAI
jgi:hypothetical protein